MLSRICVALLGHAVVISDFHRMSDWDKTTMLASVQSKEKCISETQSVKLEEKCFSRARHMTFKSQQRKGVRKAIKRIT